MLSYVNAKLLINHFYTGWKTTKILKDGRLVKAVSRAAAAYGRQLKKLNNQIDLIIIFT